MIDTSAIIAIVKKEPGYESLREAIVTDPDPKMSTVTAVEFHIVMTAGLGFPPKAVLGVLQSLGIRLIQFDLAQMKIAGKAYDRFGRGSGNPAKLNFGDCLSYALATHLGEPLLFVGDDFPQTDLAPAT